MTPVSGSLSFYCAAPQQRVALDDFKELGQTRIKLLSRINARWHFHSTSNPPKSLVDELFELQEGTDADLLSHYILRLALCRVLDAWNWLLSTESKLFAVRLGKLPSYAAVALLSSEGITYELLDGHGPYCDKTDKGFYRVPFTDAPQLVNHREVVIYDGFCLVPVRKMSVVAVHHFKRALNDQLRDLQCALPAQRLELERLTPILDELVVEAQVLSNSVTTATKKSALPKLDVNKIDQVAEMHFPLCMKQLHRKLRENHHLKYDGRVQYRLFLKGAGFSVHDCIQFFRFEFIKTIPAAKFDKEYTYHIRHSYGLEGSRRDYSPLTCEHILSDGAPRHGQYHGCPFKHWDRQALQDEVNRCGVPVHTALEIIHHASTGNYQRACTSFFKATHCGDTLPQLATPPIGFSNADSDRTVAAPFVMHPNAYLNASLATLN